jgi:DNA polymerase III epsilon subunit family exonuclease
MQKCKWTIVDIETTGLRPSQDRIIEIALILTDGQNILESFQTLINPVRSMPFGITRLTGITQYQLDSAPEFYQVAKKIVELTQGTTLVAHNARFDYTFLKYEFSQLGYTYSLPVECSVQLSKKNFPGLRSYSLGALSQEFNLPMSRHHRALSDAHATFELFKLILKRNDSQILPTHKSSPKSKATHLHAILPPSLQTLMPTLPHETGVYFLKNQAQEILYIGQSKNIYQRVHNHLKIKSDSPKSLHFYQSIAYVESIITHGALMAQIHEALLIKNHKPPYNQKLRTRQYRYRLYLYPDQTLGISPKDDLGQELCRVKGKRSGKYLLEKLNGLFKTQGKKALEDYVKKKLQLPQEKFLLKISHKNHPSVSLVFCDGGKFKSYVFGLHRSELKTDFIQSEDDILRKLHYKIHHTLQDNPDLIQILMRYRDSWKDLGKWGDLRCFEFWE